MSDEQPPRPKLEDPQAERALVRALRERKGRATLGDLVVATGVPKLQAENVLRSMLGRYQSHLAVDDQGELLYLFDPALRPREGESKLGAALRKTATFSWWLFTTICKVGVMVVLVGYFVTFIVLALAALFASASSKNSKRGAGDLVVALARLVIEIFFLSAERRRVITERGLPPRPFYKKVFSFAFGPEAAEQWGLPTRVSPRAFEQGLLGSVRRLLGIISPSELVRFTGWSLARADEEASRLLAEYEGEPEVTEDGRILYRFPSLLVSAGGPAAEAAPPWYETAEPKIQLTGNPTGSNVGIIFMNTFNLICSGGLVYAAADPQIGLEIPIWLSWIPLIFSLLLFVVPILRAFGVRAENRRRRRRNVRRQLLAALFRSADRGQEPKLVPTEPTKTALAAADGQPGLVTQETEQLLRDLQGEPEANEQSVLIYRFPVLRDDLQAAEALRRQVDGQATRLGELVYSSAD